MSKKIVIDPGHGGSDPGAVKFGLLEKAINLDIALQLKSKLANFADVTLTRSNDTFISLSNRAALANKIGADLFISIHVNAGGGTGFESYVYLNSSMENEHISQVIHQDTANFYKTKGFMNRGLKKANFAVLRETHMPAVLLENLFIDTQADVIKLKDPRFRVEIAGAIASGVIKALNLQEAPLPTSQPTAKPTPLPNHWAEGDFQKLVKAELVQNRHNLDSSVTWGEVSTLLARLLDKLKL
ncbi:MAG: N-acetylmuramoyl-L-alanine amidase [Carboxydocellales bacterium]